MGSGDRDTLDQLLAANISPGLWQDDRYYLDRAISLGLSLAPHDWAVLVELRPARSLSWAERLVEVLSRCPSQKECLASLAEDPALRELVHDALEPD